MAQETRAQLYAKILANLPDNTTELITPATDRAVEDAEVESCYNLQDDDATDVNYTPTTSANWSPEGAPSEVGEGLDILAARTGVNLSQDIAYVSNVTTAGITPELGNPLKPFATIQAAINAVGNNSIIKALGGTYTVASNSTLASFTKDNCILDLSGCILNGRIALINANNCILNLNGSTLTDSTTVGTIITQNTNNCSILLEGGKIVGGVNLSFGNSKRVSLQGGEIEATESGQYALRVGEGSVISNCIISSSQSNAIIGEATDINETPFITNCIITSDSNIAAIQDTGNITLDTCVIKGRYGIDLGSSPITTNGLFPKFINCNIKVDDRIMLSNTLQGTGLFRGCRLEVTNAIAGENGYAFNLGGDCKDLRLYDCQIITQETCLKFDDDIDRLGDNTIFKDCIFFCNQDGLGNGEILEEGTYTSETGTTRFINCTYNKSLPTLNVTYTFDYNSTTIAGLLPQSN